MRLSNLLIVAIAVAAVFIVPAMASSGTPFSLSGQVVDRYGNPVQGADVTLIDNSYKIIAIKTTNENGNYDFVNVQSGTDTVTVRVNLTKDGKTYELPSYYVRWYPAKNIQIINSSETRFPDYPAPVYGYLYGAIQTSEGSTANFIPGIVYLASSDSGVKYYEFAENTDGKSSFTFYVPPGTYMLYAQHRENGVVYESAHKAVNVTPSAQITDILPTPIVLPLSTPNTNSGPATEPSSHENKVSGKVLTKDNKPVAGATVTLLETADNGTAFVPMIDVSGYPVTVSTGSDGNYRISGIVPTTNDGKAIQAMKDVRALVGYQDSNGNQMTIESDSKHLYYPDVILGYGHEVDARNVTIPDVIIPIAHDGWMQVTSEPEGAYIFVDNQQLFDDNGNPLTTPGTAYISAGTHAIKITKDGYNDAFGTIKMEAGKEHAPYAVTLERSALPAGLAFLPLLAAVVIGILCLVGLYLFLNRKGK